MISQAAINLMTGAAAGMDVFDGAGGPHTPTGQIKGWKYCVCLAETVLSAINDTGNSPSTGLVGPTYSAGSLLAANELFNSITLTSGTVAMIRGS